MSNLTKDDIAHLAKLANLKLTQEQIEKYRKQLSSIITHFEQLAEVDTEGVEPTSQTTGLTDIVREDKVDISQTLDVDAALGGTDKVRNNYFVVPAILNKE